MYSYVVCTCFLLHIANCISTAVASQSLHHNIILEIEDHPSVSRTGTVDSKRVSTPANRLSRPSLVLNVGRRERDIYIYILPFCSRLALFCLVLFKRIYISLRRVTIYLLVFWVILSTSSFYILYGQGNLFAGVLSDFVYFFFLHFIWARQSICWCFEWFCLLLLFTFYMGKAIYLLEFWVILSTSSLYTLYEQGNLFAGVLSDFVYFFFLHFIWASESLCLCHASVYC